MCILILTKKDGTPFDVTSVLEEDIIKICVRLGHTHPMGVPMEPLRQWFYVRKPLLIRASAPSETHMRAHMTAVGGKPSRT